MNKSLKIVLNDSGQGIGRSHLAQKSSFRASENGWTLAKRETTMK